MSGWGPLFGRCEGTMSRRSFLRAGVLGVGSMTLADVLRAQAATNSPSNDKSIIFLWLWGGPSHMETFDLKPNAPIEYRGDFRPISTNVPGLDISEHLPKLAQHGDKIAIIRSLSHDSPGHVNSTHTMMTGYPGELVETPPYHPKYPDFSSVVTRAVGPRRPGTPTHVAFPSIRYGGSAFLGNGLDPLNVSGNPEKPDFKVPALNIDATTLKTLEDRASLRGQLDRFERAHDQTGIMNSLDTFQHQALSMLANNAVRNAFDMDREPDAIRDRYGRHEVGQRCLLARRLVEAGVRLVTIDFPCVPGQKAFSWDDHASVWNIFDQMKIRLPILDQVVSALISDLHERGLSEKVMLVVMGEMSHTPRISYHNGNPGREHWGRSMSVLLSGGGLPMGQAIGSTNSKGDEPHDRPFVPGDLLATWYKYLGVPVDQHYPDLFGRPTPILSQGKPIAELI
ncbi:DUF1501 domain-containing protein [bacterium]|nr:DUF1501 domain-containing protein [bacterium]